LARTHSLTGAIRVKSVAREVLEELSAALKLRVGDKDSGIDDIAASTLAT